MPVQATPSSQKTKNINIKDQMIWQLGIYHFTKFDTSYSIFYILEPHSRFNIHFTLMYNCNPASLTRELIKAMYKHGVPKEIRTPKNINVFSFFGKLICALFSIKKEQTSPSDNSQLARFLQTFKKPWQQYDFQESLLFQAQLDIFSTWYNQGRAHSSLDGKVPLEVFTNRTQQGEAVLVSEWGGLLVGVYFIE